MSPFRTGLLENLKPGQLLHARVTGNQGGTSLLLKLGNTEVAAKADISARPGEKLRLQVIRASSPLELLVLGGARREDAQTRAMRSALPRQHPLSRLLNQLSGHTRDAAGAMNRKIAEKANKVVITFSGCLWC